MIGRKLRRDTRGATIVEMGFVILPLCLTLLVLFDFGYRMYAQAVLEGTLHRAARLATIGDKTPTQIDDFVKSQVKLFSKVYPPDIDKASYFQFSGVAKSEDENRNGVCEVGETYIDENKNGMWDNGSNSGNTGLGGSDDIVFYTVTLKFPRLVPLARFMGWSSTETVTANTVLRNQPYGAQAQLPSPIPCP
ncbi:TadE/TadG family type IV pilus assembly protein [Sphingomonas jatrophae]|uniref:TadE-like protein n=1 Tax=Sphingomonas jatrophae TaxID=1166337 RepID=A0A1I6JJA9_9SPHN|nr:TadE/TadG family type IV pilus assembly protein [Sphingomonas jatrophae]SFR79022.1 TadE-like protein [Sphingomonas jatrophae]